MKYKYFLPYKETLSAEKLAYTFLRVIAVNHELSEEVISDRDKLFTFKFWKLLVNQLEIHDKLLNLYHSQINSQTEQLNQTIKQYLQCYVNYEQINWVKLSPIAYLAYNSTTTEVTEVSLFYINYGFNSATNEAQRLVIIAQKAQIKVN